MTNPFTRGLTPCQELDELDLLRPPVASCPPSGSGLVRAQVSEEKLRVPRTLEEELDDLKLTQPESTPHIRMRRSKSNIELSQRRSAQRSTNTSRTFNDVTPWVTLQSLRDTFRTQSWDNYSDSDAVSPSSSIVPLTPNKDARKTRPRSHSSASSSSDAENAEENSKTTSLLLEVWLWLHFLIIIAVFVCVTAKRGPKQLLDTSNAAKGRRS